MAKRNEIIDGLQAVVKESLQTTSGTFGCSVGMTETVNAILESCGDNASVRKFAEGWKKRLDEGVREELLCEAFVKDLKLYSDNFPELKEQYSALSVKTLQQKDNINLVKLYEGIGNGAIREDIIEDLLQYATDKTFENKMGLLESLEGYSFDPAVNALYSYVYNTLPGSEPNMKVEMIAEGELRLDEDKLRQGLNKFMDNAVNEHKAQKKHYTDIDNHIGLAEAIRKIRQSDFVNEDLSAVLSEYERALADGCREEMLFETFLQRMKAWDHIEAVNEAAKGVWNWKEPTTSQWSVELTKVMEKMANHGEYYYLVPLIEDAVVSFQENPNPQTKAVLLSQVRMYSSPFMNEIAQIVSNFTDKKHQLIDDGQLAAHAARVDEVYSSVQYVKENECVFAVEGMYFVKKGQAITRLDRAAEANLSESFKALAKLVNDPRIAINEDNTITFSAEDGTVFQISESGCMVNEHMESAEDLKNLPLMHETHNNWNDLDFITAAFLTENFDRIAKLGFVNTIRLNESYDRTLNLFRVKNGMFIESHDWVNESHTFYRNVSTVQASGIINEHFGLAVSGLFEDLLPGKARVKTEVNEIRKSYEDRINKLNEVLGRLNEMAGNAAESEIAEINAAIKSAKDDLREAKAEYLKFQKNVRELFEGKKKNKMTEKAGLVVEDDEVPVEDEGGEDEFADFDFTMDDDMIKGDGEEGSDGAGDGYEGSDGDFNDFDGSDDGDEYTTSDGDDMTSPVEGGEEGDDESFTTDPFTEDDEPVDTGDFKESDYDIDAEDKPEGDTEDLLPGEEEDPFNKPGDGLDDDMFSEEPGADDALPTEGAPAETEYDYPNFKIVKIDFDENVRTGAKNNTGKAIVVVPWIDAEGNKTSETRTVDFYVANIGEDKGVIFDAGGMSVEMYNALKQAIMESPAYAEIEAGGAPERSGDPTAVTVDPGAPVADDEPEEVKPVIDPANAAENPDNTPTEDPEVIEEPVGEPAEEPDNIFGSDGETTTITMDDDIAPHGLKFPTYDMGDGAESELPAPSDDDVDSLPEKKIDMTGYSKVNESAEAGVTEEEKLMFGAIDEAFQVQQQAMREDAGEEPADEPEEPADDPDDEKPVVDTREDVDPMALVNDILLEYDPEIDVTSNDYDIDGHSVDSVNAIIGGSSWTFFKNEDGDTYAAKTEDFDENSQDWETFDAWLDHQDSEDITFEGNEPEDIAQLVADVIKAETGEDWEYESLPDDEQQAVLDGEGEGEIDEDAKVRLKKN